ncbi:Sjoegren syndrome nuclear autoantigen 1 [Thalassophryne amazonica]|uniref:Sjoegren syndrome nuclear autoantigen 1 n=1 Tax=Thalassophryne amazonica TaxID=390379 RepID=UPI001470DBAD|nr:Sjoegren syndrome nuclear autoantigen 1 [Thalassophryne amazonica]
MKSTMTQQAAALQTYNNELVKCIEDLCSKREELNRLIKQEEAEKEQLEHDIRVLSDKLSRVNESLTQRLTTRATYDRTIAETEAAYTKILESSHSLLSVLKQEAENLSRATELRRNHKT